MTKHIPRLLLIIFFYVKDIIELDKLYSEIPVTFKKL